MWNIFCYLEMALHTGTPLHELADDMKRYTIQMKEMQQTKPRYTVLCMLQLVLNLAGLSNNPKNFQEGVAWTEAHSIESYEWEVVMRRYQVRAESFNEFCWGGW